MDHRNLTAYLLLATAVMERKIMSYKLVFWLEGGKEGDQPRPVLTEKKQMIIDIPEADLAKVDEAFADKLSKAIEKFGDSGALRKTMGRGAWINEVLIGIGVQMAKWLEVELAPKYGCDYPSMIAVDAERDRLRHTLGDRHD